MTTLETALLYAGYGWRVFPVASGQKKPPLVGFTTEASTDPAIIRQWWARWPDANLAIATGAVSRLLVLDIDADPNQGKDGPRSLAALEATHGLLPPTFEVATPSGGRHLYFAYPQGIGITIGQGLGEFGGLDFRGESGYVLAPPSRLLLGGTYQVRCDTLRATAPEWLVDFLVAGAASTAAAAAPAPASGQRPLFRSSSEEEDELRSAVFALSADCNRSVWRNVGMGLKDELGEAGFSMWAEWSGTAPGRLPKAGESSLRAQWDSFKGQGIKKGTIFHMAYEAGWRPPDPTAEIMQIRGLGTGRPSVGPGVTYAQAVPCEAEEAEVIDLLPTLRNCEGDGKNAWARSLVDITAQVVGRVGLHGGELFERRAGPTRWLRDPTDLAAWARRHYLLDWRPVGPTWGELRSDLLAHAEPFAAVLDVPHSPPRPDVFYTTSLPPRTWPVSERLRAFLALLNPASPQDGQLLMAFLATSLWGGRPATRPLFLLSSEFGRGSGKTSTVEAISMVFGHGPLMVERLDDERLVSRILSFRGRTILFDNLTRKMQSSAIDSLITAQEINGHKMHVGQTSVANFFTFCATTNTPELSADLADRSVPIKIGQQKHGVDFASEVAGLLEGNGRFELLTDIAEWLAGPARGVPAPDRWSPWQRAVLARCEDPEGLQELILKRRGLADRDAEEAEEIYDALWEHAFLMGSPDKATGRRTLTPSECVKALKPLLGDRADNEIKWAALFGKLNKTGALRLVERSKGGKAGRGYTLSPRKGERE